MAVFFCHFSSLISFKLDMASPRTLIIIPTYNELENISKMILAVMELQQGYHILFIDDNSPDGTGDLADSLAAHDNHIHVLHRAGKEGLGKAYLAGFAWGLEKKGRAAN